jgi:hypothetical protein
MGLLQRLRVHVQQGIEGGALLVVRLDAVYVLLHQAVASQLAALEAAVNFVDGSFHELKWLSGGAIDHKHHPHARRKHSASWRTSFPPMSSLNI